jgi:hypothetical protein
VLHHVWRGDGADALAPERLAALRERLAPTRDPDGDDVKRELRDASDEAVARGLFGVPTVECRGRLFWGFDALPMLRAMLDGDPWFDGSAWDHEGAPRPGVKRSS